MFPIKDTIRSRSFPLVTWALILINTLVFFYETSLSAADLEQLIFNFGLVPADFSFSNPLT